MKKICIAILLAIIVVGTSFSTNPDSLAIAELKEKVASHEKTIDFWRNFGLPIGGITLLGFGWTVWLYFWGIGKKLDSELKSAETRAKLDALLKEVIERKEEEEWKAVLALKAKPIHVVFKAGISQKEIWSFLTDRCKFTNLIPHLATDSFDIQPNALVVFFREKADDLSETDIAKIGERLKNKARYFYFNTDNSWWTRTDVTMTNRANSLSTLEENLLKTLKA